MPTVQALTPTIFTFSSFERLVLRRFARAGRCGALISRGERTFRTPILYLSKWEIRNALSVNVQVERL
ncbi:hypothetical protein, partial [Parolsenella catena]|uniref:hypothetical protein n=1 Tax=Parolsenella catena TaxID=2003188 RepID=UPI002FDA69DB